MERINIFLARLRALFRRDSVINDIDWEMRLHIELETQDHIERGMTPAEARALARRRFGNPAAMRDIGFEYRGGMVMDKFWQDVRYGFRMFRKNPGSTFVAVLTLALGIGATAAVFSLIHGVLLTPPPYLQPDRIVLIPTVRLDGQKTSSANGWSLAQWMELQKEAKSFDGLAAYQWSFSFLTLPEGSQSLEGMAVTQDYFRVLGLQPILGRTSPESTSATNQSPAIVLGYDAWQRLFNGDPHIIGRTVIAQPHYGNHLSRWQTPATVIAVMPPGIRFLPSPSNAREPNYNVNATVDYWIPVAPAHDRLNDPEWDVVGRLKNGFTRDQAHSEVTVIAARQAEADHDFEGISAQVQSLTEELNRDGRRILLPLLLAASLVLLIACGNAAALLLVRGLGRQQEYGVRTALGAGRGTIFRQVATESLLLALLGGCAGVGLAFGIVKVLKLVGGRAIPRVDAVTVGWPVLLRAFAMQILTGFAAVAGLLTLIGIYGVLSLSVAARGREIAIRIAVGAKPRNILRLVLAEALGLVTGGMIAGVIVALAFSRVLNSFLFEVKPTDPVTLVAVGLSFALVALLACWGPARRAAKVDPIVALRYE
jgi:hypothetical protein